MATPENPVKQFYKLMTSHHRDFRYRVQDVQDNLHRQYTVLNGNADRRHREVIYTLYIGFGLVAASLMVGGLNLGRVRPPSETETTVIKDNGNSYQVEPYIRKGDKANCEVMAVWSLTEPRSDKPLATFTLPGMPECKPL